MYVSLTPQVAVLCQALNKLAVCCRSWQSSTEQLQWQISDLQRKLTDAEQRCTVWARRAGAAEARLPIHAIAANTRLKLPEKRFGLYGTTSLSPTAASTLHATASGLASGLDDTVPGQYGDAHAAHGGHADAAGVVGAAPGQHEQPPAQASTRRSGSIEHAVSSRQGGFSHALPGTDRFSGLKATSELQQEHEAGCALAMLQEALSRTPDVPGGGVERQQSFGQRRAHSLGASTSLSADSVTASLAQAARSGIILSSNDTSSPQSNCIAAVCDKRPTAARGLFQLSIVDDPAMRASAPDSPLKQRIAEYNSMILQQCISPRLSAMSPLKATGNTV